MAIVSKSEFARRKGISPAMVTKLCASGRIWNTRLPPGP
ncbi:type IV toxin-antitoxin system AbiEi family antitoxin domain-containing protein [Salmonella enterica subsp. indica]|nr:type IV toxin-antitoxin system AbiEi family antitoxin domain-containing protein [Salmonella enterica subsp. arizonae]ECF5885594.1 type IV toxin-antitoxin system AbiEi family antitoxin domain-containing protein [Salmonella enterica subsp. indica]EDR2769787.1 type IV toxin-antitoxin system AbiEi family antitoxin domain-containing protein [Salmonella enterica subsp. enterica serovar Oslo]EEJ0017643.1 type IV toxin-antitoxin system AbiEi family antitoxin domain-containing protein [Salmonella ente